MHLHGVQSCRLLRTWKSGSWKKRFSDDRTYLWTAVFQGFQFLNVTEAQITKESLLIAIEHIYGALASYDSHYCSG